VASPVEYLMAVVVFRFLDTPVDDYLISVIDPVTQAQISETVSVLDEQLFTQDLILTPTGSALLNVSFEDGTPARDAIIQLQADLLGAGFVDAGRVRTDGTAIVNNIPLGNFTIRVSNPNNGSIFVDQASVIAAHADQIDLAFVLPIDFPPTVNLVSPLAGQEIIRGELVLVEASVTDDSTTRL